LGFRHHLFDGRDEEKDVRETKEEETVQILD